MRERQRERERERKRERERERGRERETRELDVHTRNDQPSANNLILAARSIKMAVVPSMVPYYYMQMQEKIKE